MSDKQPIKAIAVIIDVKDFPKNCTVCVFQAKSQCIPQGEHSTISYSVRPKGCPLMTIEAFKVMIK
jgi:hypothetical protein